MRTQKLALLLIITSVVLIAPFTYADQIDSPVEWFKSGEKRYGLDIKYAGQKTKNDELYLTPSNCFWNHGIRAYNPTPVKNDFEKPFIAFDYEYLANWKSTEQQINWHIWFENSGSFKVDIFIDTEKSQLGSSIELSLSGKNLSRTKTLELDAKFKSPLSNITFEIPKKGKYTLTLKANKVVKKEIGKLRGIELSGPAIKDASVLRARWRPAAVHGRIGSSKVTDSKIWVVQSKTAKGTPSYSPITTPFGYYGTSFDADGRTSTSMNFSMWSFGRGKEEPPMEQLSHLIAVGSPDATFGGFGHEGTGVKLRGNWKPLAAKPTILTQALRLQPGETYDTYYGYYLDPETTKWKFFAAGKKWHKPGRGAKNLSNPGSFVEVPGPPDRQRSGDIRREGFIRGWVPDQNGKWHPMDTASKGRDKNANKTWAFLEGGWYSKAMGGMEHFDQNQDKQLTLSADAKPVPTPNFLSPENVKDLYKLPATFTVSPQATTTASEAKIKINIKDVGTNAKITVYYGTKEALTFADRWERNLNLGTITKGQATLTITHLMAKTKYYCRVLIENDQGKIWSMDTCKFTTKQSKPNSI